MAKYVINTFPQNQYTFRLYHNVNKKTWQQIKKETGCYGLINTAYFNMYTFKIDSNTMIANKWIYGPDYNEYGICIDKSGKLTIEMNNTGAFYDYTAGLPVCYINGKKYWAYKDKERNGASFIGLTKNKDVVCLIADKQQGLTTAECCNLLLQEGCVDILRFDGSWSSQGSLGPGLDLDPSQERIVALYMLIFKKGQIVPNSPKEEDNDLIKIIQNTLNKRYNTKLVVDGLWGPASNKALIIGIQTEINKLYNGKLIVDGIWGPASKAACPVVINYTGNNLAWLVQAGLAVKGFTQDIDGKYGSGTAAACARFQTSRKLEADGKCGPATFTALIS